MRVFVAGSTGAVGKSLVPHLVEHGHEVAALVRVAQKAKALEAMGAKAALADALNKGELTAAIMRAEPEVIIHQLTALAGVGNFKKFDQEFALTNRFRTEVTDTMLAAARMVGTRRFIAQSFCGWPFAREGGPVKTEEDPLDPNPPASFSKTLAAIRYLEDAVRRTVDLQALALRYGIFYGTGAGIAKDGSIVELVRKRRMPISGRFISACLLHTLAYHLGLRATAMAFLIVATPLLGCVAFDGAVIRSCLTPVRYATRDRVGRGP
jgi:2-alkyl-3-oxoalkanoate reductase